MTIFDPGLQPERTHLAWRRTALSIVVGSVVSLRALPAIFESALWLLPGIVGVLFAAWMWAVSGRRFRVFTHRPPAGADDPDAAGPHAADDAEPRVPGGAALLALSCFVVVVGVLALVVLLIAG